MAIGTSRGPVGAAVVITLVASVLAGGAIAPFDTEQAGAAPAARNPERVAKGAPDDVAVIGSTAYFITGPAPYGNELWRSGGTAATTRLVRDVQPDGADEDFANREVEAANGLVFFEANDGVHGSELWRSDGTSAGTALVADINPGDARADSWPHRLLGVGDFLYFWADTDDAGAQLWRTDGSEAGTVRVTDIADSIGHEGIGPELMAFGTTVVFAAEGGLYATEVSPDASEPDPVVLLRAGLGAPAPTFFPTEVTSIASGGELYFGGRAAGSARLQLWATDGTPEGTRMVRDTGAAGTGYGFAPSRFTTIGDTVYFRATDASTYGPELWRSDGTTAGTGPVTRTKGRQYGWSDSPHPDAVVMDDVIYYAAADSSFGTELWRSDGTAAGTKRLRNIAPGRESSDPGAFVVVGDRVYFEASDNAHGVELWSTDGTSAGTAMVTDIVRGGNSSHASPAAAAGDLLYLTTMEPTWATWALDTTRRASSFPARSKVSLKLDASTVTVGARGASGTARVLVPGYTAQPRGTLTISVDGVVRKTVTLRAAQHGIVEFALTPFTKAGIHEITAEYSGSGVVEPSKSVARTVTARR